MSKLTKGAGKLLERLCWYGSFGIGRSVTEARDLVTEGLADWAPTPEGFIGRGLLTITDLGRSALTNGGGNAK